MPHVRGPWPPGCLAVVALFSLVHSQHGKEGLEAGTGSGAGRWAHGRGSPYSTENPEPASRWASAHGIQLREGVWCSRLAGWDYFSLAIWRAGWG